MTFIDYNGLSLFKIERVRIVLLQPLKKFVNNWLQNYFGLIDRTYKAHVCLVLMFEVYSFKIVKYVIKNEVYYQVLILGLNFNVFALNSKIWSMFEKHYVVKSQIKFKS